ncbi:hypothetical protein cce_4644 [Crocosphaera subtropica ATCC 51142]|uniref:Uncharacterized protein n=1 Tax=Crocosphaera subtropica (strain ATCC 51142 / BH68) TaxID=43989 RepID=B1WW64_CROS5|nr:hypothetical protein cce_4644 [Crocosphaera subtropica ATCC 51142]
MFHSSLLSCKELRKSAIAWVAYIAGNLPVRLT